MAKSRQARFCSQKCRYRHRDRRKYWSDPERARGEANAKYALTHAQLLRYHETKVLAGPNSCKQCGAQTASSRRLYCGAECSRKARAEQGRRSKQARGVGSSTAQGYGTAHRRLREGWARKVEAGGVDCARCGEPIEPGTPWDLGHDDTDRSRYQGPEHAKCNRATAGRDARKMSRAW